MKNSYRQVERVEVENVEEMIGDIDFVRDLASIEKVNWHQALEMLPRELGAEVKALIDRVRVSLELGLGELVGVNVDGIEDASQLLGRMREYDNDKLAEVVLGVLGNDFDGRAEVLKYVLTLIVLSFLSMAVATYWSGMMNADLDTAEGRMMLEKFYWAWGGLVAGSGVIAGVSPARKMQKRWKDLGGLGRAMLSAKVEEAIDFDGPERFSEQAQEIVAKYCRLIADVSEIDEKVEKAWGLVWQAYLKGQAERWEKGNGDFCLQRKMYDRRGDLCAVMVADTRRLLADSEVVFGVPTYGKRVEEVMNDEFEMEPVNEENDDEVLEPRRESVKMVATRD